MLSTSSKYALKAVLYLAVHAREDRKLMVRDVCKPINVPQAYLAKLLQELSRNDIVSSTRGPKGGFYLTEKNKKGSLLRIIHAIDGARRTESCMLSIQNCDMHQPCPLHALVNASRYQMLENLKNKTVEDMTYSIENGVAFLPL